MRHPVRSALAASVLSGTLAICFSVGDLVQPAIDHAAGRVARRAASGTIVVVELDARSLEEVASWPWPRRDYGRMIDGLRDAGAAQIAFDVDFSTPTGDADDALFAAALHRADGRVILPALTQAAGSGATDWVDAVPIPILRDASMLAAVNVRPDADGQVLTMPMAMLVAGVPRPSLPAMLVGGTGSLDNDVPIDFAIDPGTIPRISAANLLAGRVAAGSLLGKSILVGATAVQLGDRYPIPNYGVTPGVVIQAMAAETMRSRRPAFRLPDWLLLLASLPMVAAALKRPVRRALTWLGIVAMSLVTLPVGARFLGQIQLDVVAAIVAALSAMLVALVLAEGRKRRALSLTDAATGRPNRAALLSSVQAQTCWIVTARVVNLTAITGVVGEVAALRLLDQVMDRLQVSAFANRCYRLGGDRIGLLGVEADEDRLVETLGLLAQLMRTPVVIDGRALDVQVVFGYATAAGLPTDRLAAAELALDKAERTRAAVVGAHGNELSAGDGWALSLLGELDRAIAEGQIWVAFQPKLDLRTRRIKGSEALVRWAHPDRGAVRPDEFIPFAEANGRLEELTALVLDRAVAGTVSLSNGGAALGVAVNISADLLCTGRLVDTVRRTLARWDMPVERLTLEITESQVIDRLDLARECLAELKRLGVRLSVDDYGTGQSTLTYLRELKADELKIDQSFIRDLLRSRADETLVRSTIQLAHDMDMTVVAEGIEDEATLTRLAEWGCDVAQGYHVARPLPLEEFGDLLGRRRDAA